MTYGAVHRFLLRTVASRGVLSVSDFDKLAKQFPGNGEVQDLVKEINDEIRPYQQEIKIANNEVTNEEIVVFLSLGYNDATKAQNLFAANELEYFRVLIDQIMTIQSRQVTSIHAISLAKSLTKSAAQKMLDTWCRMYYLEKEGNNYALGVRAVHEFEGYLRENMPDTIEECSLCKKIVFRGYDCPGCGLAIHTRCLKNYLSKVKKWPCCKLNFSEEQLEQLNHESSSLEQTQQSSETQRVSETQVSETQQVSQTQHISVTQQSVAYDVIDEPVNENMVEDVEMIQEDTPVPSQRLSRKRKRVD